MQSAAVCTTSSINSEPASAGFAAHDVGLRLALPSRYGRLMRRIVPPSTRL